MNVAIRVPSMTRAQFLDWAATQDAPYEFDGFEPVAMTGGNNRHTRLCRNLTLLLCSRLDQTVFEVLPEGGITTVGQAVRYPDIVVAPAFGGDLDRLVPDPLIVFEVVSPTSGRVDRTVKLREYRAVSSIRRYVIVDGSAPDIDVFSRETAEAEWVLQSLSRGEITPLPEIGIEVPVDEIFRGIAFNEPTASEPVG